MRSKKSTTAINGSGVSPFVAMTRSTAFVPPSEFYVQLDEKREARVTTQKLPGSPNYLYSVYFGDVAHPVLELISCPDKNDIKTAIGRRHT